MVSIHFIIDFCEDNLKNVPGAAEAAEQLHKLLTEKLQPWRPQLPSAAYPTPPSLPRISFYTQRCIGACVPCHKTALILRINDELVSGESHDEVIQKAISAVTNPLPS